MEVDFNNLRVQIAQTYNKIVARLNSHNTNRQIEIDTDILQKEFDFLRTALVSLCCCYLENDPDVRDVSEEVGKFLIFNSVDDVPQVEK